MAPRFGFLPSLLWALASSIAVAQDSTGSAGLIYGPHHVFSVAAPPGWVLDNRAGQADLAHCAGSSHTPLAAIEIPIPSRE